MKKLFSTFLCCWMITSASYANPNNITIPLQLSQDAGTYVTLKTQKKPILTPAQQEEQLRYFRKQYFYPWDDNTLQTKFCYVPGQLGTCSDSKQLEVGTIAYYQDKKGYGDHYKPLQQNWVNQVSDNMDLNHFPNIVCSSSSGCKGIMVHNAQVRSLPSAEAFYHDFTTPGEGYPFDYIQLADLWLGTPVQMVQMTKDRQWVLVKGQGVMGWVPSQSVAKVSKHFVRRWQNAAFITPTVRKQEVASADNVSAKQMLYIGSILPRSGSFVLFPVRNHNGMARVRFIDSRHLSVSEWPLLPNAVNFVKQINALTAIPYGWGGKDFHSDCSGALRRLFISFGIWIPRSSFYQANYAGLKYSLATVSVEKRKAIIIKHTGTVKPTAFLTLISFGNTAETTSHIGLYLGTTTLNHTKVAVMFNELWGVKIVKDTQSGRALIAQSAITPVGVGDILQPAFADAGWSVSSLWEKPGMNLTTIGTSTLSYNLLHASIKTLQQKVYEYLMIK